MRSEAPLALLLVGTIILGSLLGSPVAASAVAIGPSPLAQTPRLAPTATAAPPLPEADPSALISQESLFGFLEDLTAIQAYSGWRDSGTQGEAEALAYTVQKLRGLTYLRGQGLGVERQSFRVPCSTEVWETRLHLGLNGQEIEVPADAPRGFHKDVALALRFDSDGGLNDSERDPVEAAGPAMVVGSVDEIRALKHQDVAGRILVVDYATLDVIVQGGRQLAYWAAHDLLALRPAGLVLVTRFSNEPGESHGSFVADSNPLSWVPAGQETPAIPTLYVRLEDLAGAGIDEWEDLAQVETARLTWDADVSAPGRSGNAMARIPGADPSRAVILGAHIDSPSSPGAMDDGSGSAVLLEVARVLDEARVQPAVDLYLVWFGSEELGLFGSARFAATHQELLDRTLAMLQIDCLTHPLEGMSADLMLSAWSYGRLGDERLAWPDFVGEIASQRGIEITSNNTYDLMSDNGVMTPFGVPNANMIYEGPDLEEYSPIHYAAHIHDPYDTVELAREVGDVLEQMARVALAAALETGRLDPALRVTPKAARRAVFVGSHTEAPALTPTRFTDLGQTLAMEGFDLDLIPYGQPVTPADLEDADLVVVLPVHDYPQQGQKLYDEAWSEREIAALEAYVAGGGLLVLTNSAHQLGFRGDVESYNEDWRDANAVAEPFGISYRFQTLAYRLQLVDRDSHPLMEGVVYLELVPKNGLPLAIEAADGLVLSREEAGVVAGIVPYGAAGGEVLALADVGILADAKGVSQNLPFWQNLARYAGQRAGQP